MFSKRKNKQQYKTAPKHPRFIRENKKKSSIKGPLAIATVIVIIGVWITLSFFAPSENKVTDVNIISNTPPEEEKIIPPQQLSKTLTGEINMIEAQTITETAKSTPENKIENNSTIPVLQNNIPETNKTNEVTTKENNENISSATSLSTVASEITPTISRYEQVGHLKNEGSPETTTENPLSATNSTKVEKEPAKTTEEANTSNNTNKTISSDANYTVLLASFIEAKNANILKEKLNKAGLECTVAEVKSNNQLWYRVTSGSFNTKNEADKHGQYLKKKKLIAPDSQYFIRKLN